MGRKKFKKIRSGDFNVHLDTDWMYTAEFDFKKGQEGPGLVLKNVYQGDYHVARDIRIQRIYLKSKGGFTAGSARNWRDITKKEPVEESFTVGGGFDLKSKAQSFSTDEKGPRGFYRPKHGLTASFLKKRNLGELQDLEITQEYLFTGYGKDPSHEPSGDLPAARIYPLTRIKVPSTKLGDPTSEIESIRVDYRFDLAMDSMKPAGALGKARSSGKVVDTQAGLWTDRESVNVVSLRALKSDASVVFSQAEKPLKYEVVATGMEDGRHLRGHWDNIHEWPVIFHTTTGQQKLPPTPGAPHAFHLHWRWGAVAYKGVTLLLEGGKQYGGLDPGINPKDVFAPTGRPDFAGGLMIDPRLPYQTLKIAVTRRDLIPEIEKQAVNNAFDDFGEMFSKNSVRKSPARIDKGAELVTWVSITAHRFPHDRARLSRSQKKSQDLEGTLFAHGLFFAHETNSAVPTIIAPLGIFNKQYIPKKPKQKWVR